jgi:hypothetical protein
VSFRRPTADGIATKQGLLAILVGLYEKIDKPGGGNLTEFIKTVINETVTGGAAGGTLADFSSSDLVSTTLTTEWCAPEFCFPFLAIGIAKPTLNISAALYTASAGGTAQYRLRVGGVLGATGLPDTAGTLVGASAQASSAFGHQQITGTIPNPGGIVLVKLTMQAGTAAAKVRGLHVVVS